MSADATSVTNTGPSRRVEIAVPSRIGPMDPPGLATEYREDHDRQDLASVLAEIRFFVPTYMGTSENLALMSRMPQLEVCQLLTAGFESVIAHLPNGVTLCNAAGVHDASTAELAVGLMLASLRGVDDAVRAAPTGTWDHRTRPALADRYVVVVGAGGVGRAIQRRLEPFEVTITMVGRSNRPGVVAASDLPSLLADADVVVLAVPLEGSTRGLVDAEFLARMKDDALLVNVSRGPVVDTDALVAELATGRLMAALDVTDPEPLPPEHNLWRSPRVIITPHVGGDSTAFVPRARRLVTSQIERWTADQPIENVVVEGSGPTTR